MGVNEEDGNDSDLRVNNFTCVVCVKIIIIVIILICYHLHSYLPDTNHAPRADNAAVVLQLQRMVHVVLLPVTKPFITLHYYFSKYVCSAQYGCFL